MIMLSVLAEVEAAFTNNDSSTCHNLFYAECNGQLPDLRLEMPEIKWFQ
jgi:hypothetical protein